MAAPIPPPELNFTGGSADGDVFSTFEGNDVHLGGIRFGAEGNINMVIIFAVLGLLVYRSFIK